MTAQTKERKVIRLQSYDYTSSGSYFVTINIHNRELLLGNIQNGEMCLSKAGILIRQAWLDLPTHYSTLSLDEACIMPDHFHGIMTIQSDGGPYSLFEMVRAFKSFSARRINQLRKTPGVPVWQRGYYEHIIRNEEDLNRIRLYIRENPLKWACSKADDDWSEQVSSDR